jgi:TPP-dependent pyruvate/acetoin dehydrogenase alpha subunit
MHRAAPPAGAAVGLAEHLGHHRSRGNAARQRLTVLAVETATRRAAAAVAGGEGPRFLEARTYRFRAHSMYDPDLYRPKDEIERWKERDPIARFTAALRERGLLDDAALAAVESSVAAEIDGAVAEAEAGPWEPVEDLLKDVYTVPETR